LKGLFCGLFLICLKIPKLKDLAIVPKVRKEQSWPGDQAKRVIPSASFLQREKGSSLVEMVIGLFLASVLLALSGFYYSQWMPRFQLERAVQQVTNDIQLARIKAISQNCFYRLQFSPVDDSYRMERESLNGQPSWPGVLEGLCRQFSRVDNPYHCPGVKLESSSSHPIFSPRGTVVGATIILKSAAMRKVITLSTQGRVKVQEG
jgi:Tfp pilus assembly protein FimT